MIFKLFMESMFFFVSNTVCQGRSVLHVAATNGRHEIITVLLSDEGKHKAVNLFDRDHNGKTASELAKIELKDAMGGKRSKLSLNGKTDKEALNP